MCFHIKVTTDSQLQIKQGSNRVASEDLLKKTIANSDLPLYHVSGFKHPKVIIYKNDAPNTPCVSSWGLVPNWVKNEKQQKQIQDKTLNARSETIFKKPSFKEATLNNRCIIYVDGFYEFYHFNGKVYPHFVYQKDKKPMCLAGLYSTWKNPITEEVLNTFTIVTSKGNNFMAKIHNSPKLKEPRIPIILNKENKEFWLHNVTCKEDIDKINSIPDSILESHTVKSLSGKNYVGNIKSISEKYNYPELSISKLFDA